ncbi:HK97 family phage prohead protease [Streptomyces sp. NBC_01237]|uniref:HK97 family phage prohead protease n=1 Tax=Streptomyces sp. NBC_01237 TaxID=2903790 RepID=UPI002DDAC86C|nr:HK97 family phage prohead protease [Streptomyces sp. NBC_01237]WRZ72882.1 HK97 family phage prohead protease [Streptomyces sp. NBC_01237]
MSTMTALRAQAAAARSAAADTGASGAPSTMLPRDRPESPEVRFRSSLRAKKVLRDEQEWFEVSGYASAFEQGYEMYDFYGPYTEVVSHGAADATLAADPEVVFRFNHSGTPMAGTRNQRLQLWADDSGLGQRAWLNPKRADVQLLVQALEDDDVREQSFMFRITSGQWSPDYTEYRINAFDLDRGDVGPVTYGANPHTSVSARAGDFLASIPNLPPLMAREALARLTQRTDIGAPPALPTPAPTPAPAPAPAAPPAQQGRSITMLRTQLLVDADEG